jgi:hypothetical protein
MAEKKVYITGVTPTGVAVFPHLNKPDEYKGNKDFKTSLKLTAHEAADLIAKLTPLVEASYGAAEVELQEKIANGKDGKTKAAAKKCLETLLRSYPWTDDVDEDGEPSGDILFKFKSKAEYEDAKGVTRKITIPLFDAKRKASTAQVTFGSLIKVNYTVAPFFMSGTGLAGISLRLNGVQIRQLATGNYKADPTAMGFDEDEDGYSEEDALKAESQDEEGDDIDDEDF